MNGNKKFKTPAILLKDRILTVQKMILDGLKFGEIVQVCNKPKIVDVRGREKGLGWNLSERQIANYYREALKDIKKLPDKNELQMYLRKTLMRYEDLYTRSISKGNLRDCITINDKISNLLGLNELSKDILEIRTNDDKVVTVNFISGNDN